MDHGRMLAEGTLRELQERLGGDRLFVMDGAWSGVQPDSWPEFSSRFRVLQQSDRQLVVAARDARDPSDCLRELLALPVQLENVMLKRPTLNDVFLQLTGRNLRE
jgi:ABC-2 type transport system ATP-binding protein